MNSRTQLYSLHERIWHWLQALAILFLILSGLAIHYPDRFGILGSMATALRWHSWLGWALILNACLGIFYHLTAEKYHHFLPRMEDFTGAAVRQARFYLYGIFKGEKHPLETDPRRKLNPLQRITYLLLLNILLPFQMVTGILLWGADRWPLLLAKFGGLKVLGPAHTLGAYLFLAFLIGHIYLATTGPTPMTLLRAIVTGHEISQTADCEVKIDASAD
ncbi:MAG TPA: cytochrome b/b6 domain-containing protein [Candidatus Acidoferrum sp.]|nr:cytochrome b/b6 domain-containing protein [Candidatus Acidoferrum sp.]